RVGALRRRAAVRGVVPGLERRSAGVMRRDEVSGGDPREDRAPPIWMDACIETREAATPGPPAPVDTAGIDDALGFEGIEARDDVLRLREADGPDQRAAERHAVSRGTAVVDEHDRVSGVDERLGLRVEAIALVPLGTAVHRHHGGERSMTRRGHHERVDPVAAGVGEEERPERPASWWWFLGAREHLPAILI